MHPFMVVGQQGWKGQRSDADAAHRRGLANRELASQKKKKLREIQREK
jgi:hypothetical protein